MRIEIDDRSGFCFGVVNAISKAEESLSTGGRVCCIGDIVHNRVEVQRLQELGLDTVTHEQLPWLEGCRVLIRAHGEPPSTYRVLKERGLEVVDATCPVVERLQQKVVRAHREMSQVGGQVVILGKKGHAEVVGLSGQVDGGVIVVEGLEDLHLIDHTRPVYLLSQTTQSLPLFEQVKAALTECSQAPGSLRVMDTICRQVSNREPHLCRFASDFDVVVFVSGRKSSNGKFLFGVCRSANERSHNIEDETELDPAWFEGAASVGVCGATSTPKWLMARVANKIEELNR